MGRRGGRRVVAAALLCLVLGGCSAQAGQPPTTGTTTVSGTTAPVTTTTGRSAPTRIDIPRIGASSTLVPLGLNPDQTIEVPTLEQPMQAGWYHLGAAPGEVGPAVILGHVDAHGRPGIFYRLRELRIGDEIRVGRENGGTLTFVVKRVQQIAKSAFPSNDVYGPTDQPELRVITCGGSFDRAARSYRDNTIIYAALAAGP